MVTASGRPSNFPDSLSIGHSPKVHASTTVAHKVEVFSVRRPDRIPVHRRIVCHLDWDAAASRNSPDVSLCAISSDPDKQSYIHVVTSSVPTASILVISRFAPVATSTAQSGLFALTREPGSIIPASAHAISFPSGDQAGL